MKPSHTFTGIAVALMVTVTVVSVRAGKPGPTGNVTSQLLVPTDPLTSQPGAAPVFFSDYLTSGINTYVTTNGSDSVGSIFQPGGDWQLDTTSSSSRAVWLDLGNSSLPFNAHNVHSLLTTHCGISATTPVAFLTTAGSSTHCPMSFRINWGSNNSVFYRIHFNPINHPGTADVAFTCNPASNNACVDWTGRPADNEGTNDQGDGRSTGKLVTVTSTKGGEVETLIGYYPVLFQMHITKP